MVVMTLQYVDMILKCLCARKISFLVLLFGATTTVE